MSRLVTLVVPTLNRPDFIVRLLRYYRDADFAGVLLIGDSSRPEHVACIRRAIAQHGQGLRIAYRQMPGLGAAPCLAQLAALIETPYVAFMPDDDLYLVPALVRCVRFLEEHPDYSAAHGVGVIINVDTNSAFGRVTEAAPYPIAAHEAGQPSRRLLEHLARYTVTPYSVRRREQFVQSAVVDPPMADLSFALELYPAALLALQGKIKALEGLFVVRQRYYQQYHIVPPFLEWMTKPAWLPSFVIYRERLADALTQHETITLAEARTLVERGFWQYFNTCLTATLRRATPPRPRGLRRLAQSIRRAPVAARAWSALRRWIPGREPALFLPRLRRGGSPYSGEFAIVERLLGSQAGQPARASAGGKLLEPTAGSAHGADSEALFAASTEGNPQP